MTTPTAPDIQDIPEVPEEQQGDGLPRLFWANGDRKAGTPGFFRIAQDHFDTPLPEPWEAKKIVFDSGGSEDDYVTPKLRMMIIAVRQQAFIKERLEGNKERKIWLPTRFMERGAANQSVYAEFLCLVEGLEGTPLVWAAPAIKTSMAMVAPGGILDEVRLLQKIAKQTWKIKVNRWAFWIPIKTTVDKDNNTVYEQTKGKPVTPPRAYVPKKDPLALYVGDDLYRYGYEVWGEFGDWAQQMRGGVEEIPTDDTAPQLPAGRNVPVPFDEDDAF